MKKNLNSLSEADLEKQTNAYKKIWNYIEDLSNDEKFQKEIKTTRKKYGLPIGGYKEYEYVVRDGQKLITQPKNLNGSKFWSEISEIAENFGIDYMWQEVIFHYAAYNNFDVKPFHSWAITTFDIKEILDEPELIHYENETWTEQAALESLKRIAELNPVAILINPYATQRDIIDYVKKMYKRGIEPMLNMYQNPHLKIGKVRKKNFIIKQRNDFIYKNRKLPSQEIVKLVAEKFTQILDYTYISKIIGDEVRKRSVHR